MASHITDLDVDYNHKFKVIWSHILQDGGDFGSKQVTINDQNVVLVVCGNYSHIQGCWVCISLDLMNRLNCDTNIVDKLLQQPFYSLTSMYLAKALQMGKSLWKSYIVSN